MARRRQTSYWGAITLDTFLYLQDENLQSSDYKIFFLLCSRMIRETNIAHIRQKSISEILKLHKSSVSKSIKRLMERQIIGKIENGYMINPHLFYVGKARAEDREQIRYDFDKRIIERDLQRRFYMDEHESRLIDYGFNIKLTVEERKNTEDDLEIDYSNRTF